MFDWSKLSELQSKVYIKVSVAKLLDYDNKSFIVKVLNDDEVDTFLNVYNFYFDTGFCVGQKVGIVYDEQSQIYVIIAVEA